MTVQTKSRPRRVGIAGLTLAMLASILMLVGGAPVEAQGSCNQLSVSTSTLSGGSSNCYYVVTEAFGSWDKACEGNGGSLNCRNLDARNHKVDMFTRSPWANAGSYEVAVPGSGTNTGCSRLSVSTERLSGGSSSCYYVVLEAFGSWDKACEGNGGSLNCRNLEARKHKVDVYKRNPWSKVESYDVNVPGRADDPNDDPPGNQCNQLSVATSRLSGGSSSCYYVILEAFGAWDNVCEGRGGSLNCAGLQARTHKVDIYTRQPWAKSGDYLVDVPGSGSDPNPGGDQPDIDAGEFGSNLNYSVDFVEDFDSGLENWHIIDMENDRDHQAGNSGVTANGNVDSRKPLCRNEGAGQSYNSPLITEGKRWAAWYNDHTDRTLRVRNDRLEFGGRYVREPDPTRAPFEFGNTTSRFDEHRFYTSFLATWDRGSDNVTANQNRTWGPGTYAEMRVSFEQMRTRGFRLSFWMMPSGSNAGNAYDGRANNGVEIDIFEYDPSPIRQTDLAMKVAGNDSSDSTNSPIGGIYENHAGLDQGFHTIGLLWTNNRLVWYVDGQEVQRDNVNVPDVDHYIIVSREMNSGVSCNASTSVKAPSDGGLWADGDVWENSVWIDRDRVNNDRAIIDYVKVWDVS